MPNPYGSPGNKGGGRQKQEIEIFEKTWHIEKWQEASILKALEKKIADGKYSVRDMFLYKALKGDRVLLSKFVDKVLPNLIGGTGEGGEFIVKWKDE